MSMRRHGKGTKWKIYDPTQTVKPGKSLGKAGYLMTRNPQGAVADRDGVRRPSQTHMVNDIFSRANAPHVSNTEYHADIRSPHIVRNNLDSIKFCIF